MGLGFLTPLFFAGLAALIAPILVHLVRRQDPVGIRFPSLMFLQRIPFEERRRRKIRHWALLVLRCLALSLLVLAFARPFVSSDDSGALSAPGQRDVVVLLDRSYSMGYADRWVRAQAAALEAIDNLAAGDRATVVLFDRQAHLTGPLSTDKTALKAAVEHAELSVEVTDFRAALDQAALALAESVAPQREIVMISDFQRSGVDPADVLHLPAGITLSPRSIISEDATNVAVGSLNLDRHRQNGRERITVTAQIVNRGDQAVARQRIALEINGHEQEAHELQLAAGASGNISFDLVAPREPARAVLRLAADGLPQDNAFYFVLAPVPSLSVLVVENNEPRPNQSLFLTSALALSDAPAYSVDIKPADELQIADFNDHVMIIINDAPIPGGALGVRLRQFVEDGGGLLVAVGEHLQGGWPGGVDGFLPGTLGSLSDMTDSRTNSIGYLDYAHPVFELFQKPDSGNFAGTQVFRYRELTTTVDDRVLARFDDGGIALAERRVGAGRVVVLMTTLDTYWNDLAVQPVFVPFLHQLAKYLSDYEGAPAWIAVGDVVDLVRYARASAGGEALGAALARGEEAVVQTPSGEVNRLGGDQALLIAAEHGVYEVYGAVGNGSETMVAVNLDPVESDLTVLDVPAFVDDIETRAAAKPSEPAKPLSVLRKQAEQQQIWWYVLIAAMIVFIAETVVSNRLSRTPERQNADTPSGA